MKYIVVFALLYILVGCGEPAKPVSSPKEKFDAIENIVGTANWRLTAAGHDTSYVYFSRLGDTQFNVYWYTIDKGDSVNTRVDNILSNGDSVIWSHSANAERSLLVNAGDTLTWEGIDKKDRYIIAKQDSNRALLHFPNGTVYSMKRTLPLGVFLVRKQYDYKHGTSYVDSAEVPPRKVHSIYDTTNLLKK